MFTENNVCFVEIERKMNSKKKNKVVEKLKNVLTKHRSQ